MTLGLELLGAFLAGIGFTLVLLALLAPRLSRWAMQRMMTKAVIGVAAANISEEPSAFMPSPQTIEALRDK